MRKIHLHVLAESDLLEVWQYSLEQWDADQADKYLDEINEGIGRLAENPELGAKRDYVRSGYRALLINRHAVYYTVKASTIHIVRVLHGQMDPERHL
jgi:toxin ParE1/3/4